jgi:hypothetical protein
MVINNKSDGVLVHLKLAFVFVDEFPSASLQPDDL